MMPTKAYCTAKKELDFLGDILSKGILNKGLAKIGSTPETVGKGDMVKALDAHVEAALVNFVGSKEAHKKVQEIKKKLENA